MVTRALLRKALENARRELAAAKNAAPKLRVTFEDGDHLELKTGVVGPLEPALRQKLLVEWREQHPLVSATPDSFVMPGGAHFDLSTLKGVPGYIAQEDADGRNAAIERRFAEYRNYLDAWPSLVNGYRRCMEIPLVLENDGNIPADDVHLELWTDAKGIWLEELPEVEQPPRMPKSLGMFDLGALRPPLHDIDVGGLRDHDAPIDGPNIPEDDAAEVQYTVRRVKHHVPCALPKVYFQFESDADVGSFTINYRLVAANIREWREGKLNVKITLRDLASPPNPEEVFSEREDDDK